jgi:hypothetical protein
LDEGFWLGGHGVPDPFAVFVENLSDGLGALFASTALDIICLLGLLEVELQLFHLLFLEALQAGERGLKTGLHFLCEGPLALYHDASHLRHRLREAGLKVRGIEFRTAICQRTHGEPGPGRSQHTAARWLCDGSPEVAAITPDGTVVAHQWRHMLFLQPHRGAEPLQTNA